MSEEKVLSGTITKEKDVFPTSTAGDIDDHEVDLRVVTSNQFSINEVAESLTAEQKFIILKRMQLDHLVALNDLPVLATFILDKVEKMNDTEALNILKDALIEHDNDANFSSELYDFIQKLVDHAGESTGLTSIQSKTNFDEKNGGLNEKSFEVNSNEKSENIEANADDYFKDIFDWSLQVRTEAVLMAYWSPYPEVRAATDPYDDPNEHCETVRAYIAGLIWVGISSFVNQYFAQRMPPITLPAAACQVLVYPTGVALSYLPDYKIPLFKGYSIRTSPGSWTTKEQMLATMMVSITTTPYIEGPLYAQRMPSFYNQKWVTWGYEVLLGISTQFVGFGLAGIVRKFCIYPAKSLWPSILPTIAANRAFLVPEKKENINGWTISRYYYFFAVFAFSFVWFWFPGYIFQALSTFNWMTWIKPDNFNLATITGSYSGLGLNPIPTFDWNVINLWALPLTYPAFNTVNSFIGAVVGLFAIIGVYYSNYYWSAYLPINSSATYSNTGESYDIQQILNSNNKLDDKKYQAYGPPFYTAANIVLYGCFFLSYPFTIFYVFCTNWKDIVFAMKSLWLSLKDFRRSSLAGYSDPHCKMMSRYKEVPEWVFLIVLVISIVLGIICVEIYPTQTPVWGIFFTIAINFVFLIPFTVLYSITGYQLTMNVLVELIIGYALPGNPNAHLILKSFGTQTDMQAQDYISNQKIAHYAKIPPWSAFRVQILATFVNLFISLAVINWQVDSFEGLCTADQAQHFTCAADAQIYYSASVIWGVVGPKRVFDGLYPILRWCFLIGLLMVPPCYLVFRLLPKAYRKWWQPTIMIGAVLNFFAPYNLSYITPGLYLSLLFMVYIKNNYLPWWEKYNYLTTAGMTAGLGLCSVVLFFAVQYHPKDVNWWGNSVPYAGIDGEGVASLKSPASAPGGYFGPRKGHFP
ncbi:uncharacterized protein PRCAT00004235001 [Priceomyces carsonii]|uniref:uncharacterized protein n=1 Tax=Priceomyces carsonii TaxID=28549 RepID=UPI002ED9687D|nr:unnamed protein product [Priceomyces carsonii]